MTNAFGNGAWASLSLYESPELVRRFAGESIGREPTANKAREISAHFSQGREYFRSAAGAGELVRPLILYYGAMALARGTALFLSREKSKIEAGHGLDATGWKDLPTQPYAVPHLEVEVSGGGTFPELARVTGNTESFLVRTQGYPGVATALSTGPKPASGTRVGVKEALGQIPDVVELYERTFGEHGRRLRCEVQVTGLPETSVTRKYALAEIPPDLEMRRHAHLGLLRSPAGLPPKDRIAGLLDDGRVVPTEGGPTTLPFAREPKLRASGAWLFDLYYDAGTSRRPRIELPVTTSTSGEEYLKLRTDRGVVLSTLLALHVVAFAAGMLVRYHPGYWAVVVGRTKGDSIAPVLSAAVAAIEERYPALILEAIGG